MFRLIKSISLFAFLAFLYFSFVVQFNNVKAACAGMVVCRSNYQHCTCASNPGITCQNSDECPNYDCDSCTTQYNEGDGLCTTATYCNRAMCPQGANWYVYQNECAGAPDPTPTPTVPPTTPPPGSTPTPTPTPTATPTLPPLTPKPGLPFIIYEDVNGNGVWDYGAGENRITPNACTDTYTKVVSGFDITVPGHANAETWHCNLGNSEGSGGCQGSQNVCNGSNCGVDLGSNDSYFNSCLGSHSCYPGGCRWTGACYGGNDTTQGALCNTNGDYCYSAGAGNLRNGPFFESHHTVGNTSAVFTLPPGYELVNKTAASIGSVSSFTCVGQTCTGTVNFATNGTAGGGFACMGTLIKFGVRRAPLPAPTNLGVSCDVGSPTATFSWDTVTGADGYIIRLDHDDQCYNASGQLIGWACTSTSNCNVSYGSGVCADQFVATKGNPSCYEANGRTNCALVIRQGENYLGWSVQPILPAEIYPYISPAAVGTTFMCQATGNVVGRVYDDANGTATATVNNCTDPDTTGVSGITIGLSTRGSLVTSGTGNVTFPNVPYGPPTNPSYTMTLDQATLPTGYTLTCPQSGAHSITSASIPNTANPLNFYITQMRSAWFQLRNGNARSESGVNPAVKSVVPSSCTAPGCNPYLFTMNSTIVATDGYAVTGVGGMLSTSETAGTPLANVRETDKVYEQSGRTAIKEGYDYFYRQFSMGTNPQDDFPAESISQLNLFDILDGFVTPKDNRTAYYISSTATITQPWNVPSGENIVIFVNGDLNIRNTIQVAQGGFLAFIVRGNVNVDVSVGSSDPTSTTSVVEGVYIADGMFRTCTNHNDACGNAVQNISDLKFVGAGTFVGWNGLALQRDFSDSALGGLANNRNPAELFYSRPDFMLYTPEEMKKPHYLWQEVNP